jgi:hypothetical protein
MMSNLANSSWKGPDGRAIGQPELWDEPGVANALPSKGNAIAAKDAPQ